MKTIIRHIEYSEIELIQYIARESWNIAYSKILSKDQSKFMLNRFYEKEYVKVKMLDGEYFYVIKNHKEAIGFLSIQHLSSKYAKIHKLYVLPKYFGEGYGYQLFEFGIKWAETKKIEKLILNVNRFNHAVSFYLKRGMRITEIVDISIGDGYLMEDYIMEINLSAFFSTNS